jgi:hypothetical protein
LEDFVARLGWLDFTVLGGRHMRETREYLACHGLEVDERGRGHDYDLVVTCSDLIVQRNIREKRLVLVQEGITEPETWVYRLVRRFGLPRYIANTSTSGLSNSYDIFCVASQGYAAHFIRKGVRPEKIAVTGIPNFDELKRACENDFPFRGHVLVATSPLRESLRRDDRDAFLRKCIQIAAGRQMIFKLHPTENIERASREIHRHVPDALILPHGNVSYMIANASVVITQQSTCTFVAEALGKELYTNLDVEELRRLMPIQNGGASAGRIASLCRRLLHTPMPVLEQVRRGLRARPKWENADSL